MTINTDITTKYIKVSLFVWWDIYTLLMFIWNSLPLMGRRGRDCMVVGFTPAYAINI
jgi:hypothetical protein